MRLAYLVADRGIPYHGVKGASVHVRAITAALAGRGHDVTCFVARTGDRESDRREATAGAKVVTVRVPGNGCELLSSSARREGESLRRNAAFLQAVSRRHGSRPFDALLERYSLWSTAGVRLARELGVPLILEVNAPLLDEQERYRKLGMRSIAHAVRDHVLRRADAVIAVSEEVAAWVRGRAGDGHRIHVVPNGFDPHLFHPAERAADRVLTIGFVGSLKPWHGVESLCRAFRAIAGHREDMRLLFVGDGPLREWIEAFRAEHGLEDRLVLTGAVSHDDVAAHLRGVDVAVAPYPEQDGFYFSPLKLYEYMGAGLAVVASDVGQVRRVVEHGRTGWLVPAGDEDALGEALSHLANDAELRRTLGSRAARIAHSRHRWSDVAARVESHVVASCERSRPVVRSPEREAETARVAYVLKRYPRLSETFIVDELLGLEAAGHDLRIVAGTDPREDLVHESVGCVLAPVTYVKHAAGRLLSADLGEALSALGERRPAAEALIARASDQASRVVAARAIVSAAVLHDDPVDHLHAHFATAAARIACATSELTGVPFSFTPHAKDLFHESVNPEILRELLERCAFVVAISQYHERYLRGLHPGARIEIVRNGIHVERFPFRERTRHGGYVRILGAGRLVEKKGFDDLLRACAVLRDEDIPFECRIVGDGDQAASLREMLVELRLEHCCHFLGARTQDAVREELARADLLAAPCVTASTGDKDGLPTVILEAMATGLPVVSTPVTAIPEVITDGETGLLVPERCPDELARAIRLLAEHAPFAKRMARAARELVEEKHDRRRNAARLGRLFAGCRVHA